MLEICLRVCVSVLCVLVLRATTTIIIIIIATINTDRQTYVFSRANQASAASQP